MLLTAFVSSSILKITLLVFLMSIFLQGLIKAIAIANTVQRWVKFSLSGDQQIRKNVKVNIYLSRLLTLYRLFAVCSTLEAIFISENAVRAPEFLRRSHLNQTAPSPPPLPIPSPFLRTGLTRDKLIYADSCPGMDFENLQKAVGSFFKL
jgi:hypothetical protein